MKSEKNEGKGGWGKRKDSIKIVRRNHKSSRYLSEGQQISRVLGRVNQSRRQGTASFQRKMHTITNNKV